MRRVVFVPVWIYRVLQRNSKKLEDLLYFERIQAIFSKSDLCNLVAMPGILPGLVGNGAIQSETICLASHWLGNLKQEQQSLRSAINSLTSVSAAVSGEETLARIYGEQGLHGSQEAKDPYETFLVGDSYIFVVVNTGHQVSDYTKKSSELIRDLLKKHYVYENYHELMSRPLGAAYVESLSR